MTADARQKSRFKTLGPLADLTLKGYSNMNDSFLLDTLQFSSGQPAVKS